MEKVGIRVRKLAESSNKRTTLALGKEKLFGGCKIGLCERSQYAQGRSNPEGVAAVRVLIGSTLKAIALSRRNFKSKDIIEMKTLKNSSSTTNTT